MSNLQKHDAIFAYFKKDTRFSYWSNTKTGAPTDTVIFLGTGQVDKIAYWVAKSAGSGVVVVGGVPHWTADPKTWDAVKFCQGYAETAFAAALEAFGLQSINVIAESQAAPAAIILAKSMPDKVRNFALIRPLGFTSAAFGDSPAARLKTFKRRMLISHLQFRQTYLHDPRNFLIDLTGFRALMQEPQKTSLSKKYAEGVSYDSSNDCKAAALALHRRGGTFTILLGEKDKLFPPNEVLDTLQRAGIKNVEVIIMPRASHGTLASRSGNAALHQALTIVRTRSAE